MTHSKANNKRIAKNTMMLYIRMFLMIIAQLYIVPILLKSMGVDDYGIYNVVAGIVLMFSFVSGSLSSGAQRFLAFAIGRERKDDLKVVFGNTLLIYLGIAIFLAVLLELFGIWFLNEKMAIPPERICAANWVFQFTIIFFILEIFTIPFRASIIAHEEMSAYAYISIGDCLIKLLVAIIVGYISYDSLIAYAVLHALGILVIVLIYFVYCRSNFEECRNIKLMWTSKVGLSLLTYSGWNIIGSLALILRNQGINIVQNLFFGPTVNAAHAVAQQVKGVATRFIDNVYVASRPTITKLFASGQTEEMWELIFKSAKLAFFLMVFICVPALLELDYVLTLWLDKAPPYTGDIAKFMILTLMIETLVNQVIASFQAANKIKIYQVCSSTILLLNIPLSYLALKVDCDPIIPYFVSVGISLFYVVSVVWTAKIVVNLDVIKYIREVVFIDVAVFLLSFITTYFIRNLLEPSFFRLIYTIIVSVSISSVIIWQIGLDNKEKNAVIHYTKTKILKK